MKEEKRELIVIGGGQLVGILQLLELQTLVRKLLLSKDIQL